jgi:Na+-transporting methylmalonyl-CoA/oxaloacetate decarboxylase gamma subunit
MSQVPPPMGGQPMNYSTPGAGKPQGLAIGALICGILSLVLFCFNIVAIPLGIVAIILGVVARGKAQRGEAGGEGLAKTGMILGIAGVALSILITILAMAGMSFLGSKAEEMQRKAQAEIERIEREQQQSTDGTATPTTTGAP